jgi:hypothetical protein
MLGTALGIGTALGGLFGGQSAGRGHDEMARQIQQAMEEQRRLTGQANDLIRPWYDAGRGNLGEYQQNYKNLMNPEFIEKLSGRYQMSPHAQFQMKQGQDAITNAASASGNLNSGQFGRNMGNYAQDITSRDQNQWLDRMLGQYNQGLGHQQGMVNTGGQYGSQMGQNLIGMGDRNMQAMMGAQNARMQGNQAREGGWASLLGGLSGLGGLVGSGTGLPNFGNFLKNNY